MEHSYVTKEDLVVINAALARGDVVKIRHTDKGGTKITKEKSQLLVSRPLIGNGMNRS